MEKTTHYPASEGVTSSSGHNPLPPSHNTTSKDTYGAHNQNYQSGMPTSTAADPTGHATTAGIPSGGYANRDSTASTAVAPTGMGTRDTTASDILLVIMAIFLPPIAVFLKRGLHVDFWINVLLCILAWFPGVLHALYVIFKYRGVSDAGGQYSKRRGI
ncbi:putative plasma membrane proteolipid 3 [Podospora australis]|uniref:Plasma membrane proteolipid 3 n=1 Tax=Podospora australis TaxID=1536484 RepID=A0AAN6WYA1_9PEZI|nr:putative plasma membrane proteolipid 3 [Podospora australis]